MITKTSLKSFKVTASIFLAMKRAIYLSKINNIGNVELKNRNGKVYMIIQHSRLKFNNGFNFYEVSNNGSLLKNINTTVLPVLRSLE